jgi:hypothetical protein
MSVEDNLRLKEEIGGDFDPTWQEVDEAGFIAAALMDYDESDNKREEEEDRSIIKAARERPIKEALVKILGLSLGAHAAFLGYMHLQPADPQLINNMQNLAGYVQVDSNVVDTQPFASENKTASSYGPKKQKPTPSMEEIIEKLDTNNSKRDFERKVRKGNAEWKKQRELEEADGKKTLDYGELKNQDVASNARDLEKRLVAENGFVKQVKDDYLVDGKLDTMNLPEFILQAGYHDYYTSGVQGLKNVSLEKATSLFNIVRKKVDVFSKHYREALDKAEFEFRTNTDDALHDYHKELRDKAMASLIKGMHEEMIKATVNVNKGYNKVNNTVMDILLDYKGQCDSLTAMFSAVLADTFPQENIKVGFQPQHMLNVLNYSGVDYLVENTVKSPNLIPAEGTLQTIIAPVDIFVAEYLLRQGVSVYELPEPIKKIYLGDGSNSGGIASSSMFAKPEKFNVTKKWPTNRGDGGRPRVLPEGDRALAETNAEVYFENIGTPKVRFDAKRLEAFESVLNNNFNLTDLISQDQIDTVQTYGSLLDYTVRGSLPKGSQVKYSMTKLRQKKIPGIVLQRLLPKQNDGVKDYAPDLDLDFHFPHGSEFEAKTYDSKVDPRRPELDFDYEKLMWDLVNNKVKVSNDLRSVLYERAKKEVDPKTALKIQAVLDKRIVSLEAFVTGKQDRISPGLFSGHIAEHEDPLISITDAGAIHQGQNRYRKYREDDAIPLFAIDDLAVFRGDDALLQAVEEHYKHQPDGLHSPDERFDNYLLLKRVGQNISDPKKMIRMLRKVQKVPSVARAVAAMQVEREITGKVANQDVLTRYFDHLLSHDHFRNILGVSTHGELYHPSHQRAELSNLLSIGLDQDTAYNTITSGIREVLKDFDRIHTLNYSAVAEVQENIDNPNYEHQRRANMAIRHAMSVIRSVPLLELFTGREEENEKIYHAFLEKIENLDVAVSAKGGGHNLYDYSSESFLEAGIHTEPVKEALLGHYKSKFNRENSRRGDYNPPENTFISAVLVTAQYVALGEGEEAATNFVRKGIDFLEEKGKGDIAEAVEPYDWEPYFLVTRDGDVASDFFENYNAILLSSQPSKGELEKVRKNYSTFYNEKALAKIMAYGVNPEKMEGIKKAISIVTKQYDNLRGGRTTDEEMRILMPESPLYK